MKRSIGGFARRKRWRITAVVLLCGSAALGNAARVGASGGYSGYLDCQHAELGLYASRACLGGTATGSADVVTEAGWSDQAGPFQTPVGQRLAETYRAFSGAPCLLYVESGVELAPLNQSEALLYFLGAKHYVNSTLVTEHYDVQFAQLEDAFYRGTWNGGTTYTVSTGGSFPVSMQFSGLGAGTCQSSVGLEETEPPSDSQTSLVTPINVSYLYWQNSTGASQTYWFTGDYYTDYPCNNLGNAPPQCLDGTYYGVSGNTFTQWSDNKPLS